MAPHNITSAYIICAGPRTGSNLLATALRPTGIAGRPREYFDPGEVDRPNLRKILGIPHDAKFSSFVDWFDRILRAGTTENGVFGVTLHWSQLKSLLAVVQGMPGYGPGTYARPIDTLRAFFPNLRFIWLRRDNMVAQAISHYLAIVTGRWQVFSDAPLVADEGDNARFDFDAIDEQVRYSMEVDEGWRGFLRNSGDLTMVLTYEQLSGDFKGAISRVLDHLDLSLGVTPFPRPELRKQAGARSQEWERRYLQECRRRRQLRNVKRDDFETSFPSAAQRPVARNAAGRRICFVTSEFRGLFRNGGIGTANTGLALLLAEAGLDVTVAFMGSDPNGPMVKDSDIAGLKEDYSSQGINLELLPLDRSLRRSSNDVRASSYAVYLYLQACQFDTVVFNECGGQGYFSLLAKHTGAFRTPPAMYVVTHGSQEWVLELNAQFYWNLPPVITSFLERRCVALADALISPSRYLLDWMSSHGWTLPRQVQVIQNIVPVSAAASDDEEAIDTAGPVTHLVFFGRLEVRKGLELFCDAIDRLERARDMKTVTVVFMGKFGHVIELHSGVYVIERARRWKSTLRILTNYGQQEALEYLRQPGILAVIPSLAENSPCVVAECLLSKVPFVATDSGGTSELVAAADRDQCLFAPNPAALAARLGDILTSGHRPASMAIPQTESAMSWLRLFVPKAANGQPKTATSRGEEMLRSPEADRQCLPLVSVCLVYESGSALTKECLDSVLRQSYPNCEVIVLAYGTGDDLVEDSSAYPEHTQAGTAVRRFRERLPDRGSARNAAAAHATGDYLVFLDEGSVILMPDCIETFIGAAKRTGADIVTGVPRQLERADLPRAEWDGWVDYFPIGACLEAGAFENCFGAANLLVSRNFFAAHGGFESGCDGAIEDWLFLADAGLAGGCLEVVPRTVFWRRSGGRTGISGSIAVSQHRRILSAFENKKMSSFAHIVESILVTGNRKGERLRQALSGVEGKARDTAIQISSSFAPNSTEALKGFVEYSVSRGRVLEALEFARHTGSPLLIQVAQTAATVAAEAAAQAAIRYVRPDYTHKIVLTKDAGERLRSVSALRAEELVRGPNIVGAYKIEFGTTIVKAPSICPPSTRSIEAIAFVDAPEPRTVLVALAACRPEARLAMSGNELKTDDLSWWSGWSRVEERNSATKVTVEIPEPVDQRLDLFLISKTEGDSTLGGWITWQSVVATVSVAGLLTPSTIELETMATPLPLHVLDRAELLTDASDFPYRVFIPGNPTFHHPLPGKLTIVRVPGAIFAGANGVRSIFSLNHAQSHPVEFAVWMRPANEPLAEDAATIADSAAGRMLVGEPFRRHQVTLTLQAPAAEPMDLYLGTRVVGYEDVDFCHAVWNEISILER